MDANREGTLSVVTRMRHYDAQQVTRYWTDREAMIQSDFEADPDGLHNVCQTADPTLNRYYHRAQLRAFSELLRSVLPAKAGARALDVGCGAARWSRLLASHGFDVTGIDLQERLLAANRRRHPSMQFQCVQVQDFETDQPFDLVTSVTVLQHLPWAEQKRAIHRLVAALRPGGSVLLLENTGDHRSPNVFPNSARRWAQLFQNEGIPLTRSIRYDYSPALRSYYASTRLLRTRAQRAAGELPTSGQNGLPGGSPMSALARADRAVRVVASLIDTPIEAALFAAKAPLSTPHCGLLLGPAR